MIQIFSRITNLRPVMLQRSIFTHKLLNRGEIQCYVTPQKKVVGPKCLLGISNSPASTQVEGTQHVVLEGRDTQIPASCIEKQFTEHSWSAMSLRRKSCSFLSSARKSLHFFPIRPMTVCPTAATHIGFANLGLVVPCGLRFFTGTSATFTDKESAMTGVEELQEQDFQHKCDDTLDSLVEKFDDLEDSDLVSKDYDVTFSQGVLTVKFGADHGTYVINKQSPNKQIWLSSPTSGPKRYDFVGGVWIYKHNGGVLHDLLTEEISKILKERIDFTQCSFGKAH